MRSGCVCVAAAAAQVSCSSVVHGTLALQLGFDHERHDEPQQNGDDEKEIHGEVALTVDNL